MCFRPDIVTMPRRETKREVRKEAKVRLGGIISWCRPPYLTCARIGRKGSQNTNLDREGIIGKSICLLFTNLCQAFHRCQERLSNGTYNSAYKFSSAKYIQELSDHHMVTRTNEVTTRTILLFLSKHHAKGKEETQGTDSYAPRARVWNWRDKHKVTYDSYPNILLCKKYYKTGRRVQ